MNIQAVHRLIPGQGQGLDAHVALAGEHHHLVRPDLQQGEGSCEDHPPHPLLKATIMQSLGAWKLNAAEAGSRCHGVQLGQDGPDAVLVTMVQRPAAANECSVHAVHLIAASSVFMVQQECEAGHVWHVVRCAGGD